jgi:pimeloyl-ACP methyl ester carboxylesterase
MGLDARRRRLALPESGVEIALLDFGGEGPLALLHHANGFCAALWAPVAERLRQRFHVVAMDARGHGDSSKPEGAAHYAWPRFGEDAAAVAQRLLAEQGGGRVALGLGHSFGGTALLVAAAARPGLFGRLVAVDPVLFTPAGSDDDPGRPERSARLVEGALRRRHDFASRDEARARFAERELFRRWDPRALELYLAEGLRDRPDGRVELKCPGAVEAAIFASARDFDLWAVASRVALPALLLWARDGDFPRAVYEAYAARMPDARVRDVDAGHLVPMERPDLVADEALAFTAAERGAVSPA